MLELNEDQLRLDLGALSHEHRALFGLSLCERLLPNASIFLHSGIISIIPA